MKREKKTDKIYNSSKLMIRDLLGFLFKLTFNVQKSKW